MLLIREFVVTQSKIVLDTQYLYLTDLWNVPRHISCKNQLLFIRLRSILSRRNIETKRSNLL